MKLRGVVMIAALASAMSVFGQDKPAAPVQPEPVAQYDLGSCGGHDYTVEHVVIDHKAGKIIFDYFMPAPDQVKKDDDNEMLVMDYKENTEKSGDVTFQGSTDFVGDDKVIVRLEFRGVIRKDRVIGVMTVNGKLARLYYGKPGNVDDMVKVVLDYERGCNYLRTASDQDDLILKLNEFLKPPDDGATKS